jgi:hypothetical protein
MKPVVGIGLFLLFFAGTCNTPIPQGPWYLDLVTVDKDTFFCACDSSFSINGSLHMLQAGIKNKQDSDVVISTALQGFRDNRTVQIRFLNGSELVTTKPREAPQWRFTSALDTGDFHMRHDTVAVVMRDRKNEFLLVHDPVSATLTLFRFGPSQREVFRQRK